MFNFLLNLYFKFNGNHFDKLIYDLYAKKEAFSTASNRILKVKCVRLYIAMLSFSVLRWIFFLLANTDEKPTYPSVDEDHG